MTYIFLARTVLRKVGGVETAVWNLAKEFVEHGKKVLIITAKGPKPIPFPQLESCVRAFDFRTLDKQNKLLGRRFAKILEMRAMANAAHDVLLEHAPNAAFVFFKPAAVHGLAKYITPTTKVCFHSQGQDYVPFDRALFDKYVTHMSACSHFNAWQNQTHFKRVPKAIHNGVPESFLKAAHSPEARTQWREKMSTPADARVYAFAGRMTSWKGLDTFIRALAKAKLPNTYLWLVGEGPALQKWLDLADSLGLSDVVRNSPFLPHAELPSMWCGADVGVFPSQGDEAFGISIAEAMACGKPVMASAFGGIPEVVGNEGSAGWLCGNADVDAYVEALHQAQSADLMDMGGAARERAKTFHWSHIAQRMLDFIDSPGTP